MNSLDLVIPIYNEEATLDHLFKRFEEVFFSKPLNHFNISNLKVIFIDDGSTDSSAKLVIDYIQTKKRGKLIRLSRNFGQQAAVTAGIENSKADLTAIMDADLQDPPEELIKMIRKLHSENADVVYAVRKNRKENFAKVFCYWLYYRLQKYLTGVNIALDSGDFLIMKQIVAENLCKLPEKIRYTRGLKSWVGFKQIEHRYDRPHRVAGNSKYPMRKLFELANTGLVSMSTRPLKITQSFTLFFSAASLIAAIILLFKTDFSSESVQSYFYPIYILNLGAISFILFCIFVMSSYLGGAFIEVKARPTYITMDTIEFADSND